MKKHLALSVAIAGALGVALVAPLTADAGGKERSLETCRGQAATHVNESGTDGDDVIVVTASDIAVYGEGGDDLICIKLDRRSVGSFAVGGAGDDTIITYGGMQNVLYGGDGDDSILSNSSEGLIDGEAGNDTIYAGLHADGLIQGGSGNDLIFGSPWRDSIDGQSGDDSMYGFGGDDEIRGGTGNDRLIGGDGFDDLHGGSNSDWCLDTAAPATTFTSCEDLVTTTIPPGPGSITLG